MQIYGLTSYSIGDVVDWYPSAQVRRPPSREPRSEVNAATLRYPAVREDGTATIISVTVAEPVSLSVVSVP